MGRQEARITLGAVMLAVALLAAILAALRASPPVGMILTVVIAVAAHRVDAVRRARPAGDRTVTPVGWALVWVDSLACAVVLMLLAALGGGVGALLAMVACGAIVQALPAGSLADVRVVVGMLAAAAALGAAVWVARRMARVLWPGPDGRVIWGLPPGAQRDR